MISKETYSFTITEEEIEGFFFFFFFSLAVFFELDLGEVKCMIKGASGWAVWCMMSRSEK